MPQLDRAQRRDSRTRSRASRIPKHGRTLALLYRDTALKRLTKLDRKPQ